MRSIISLPICYNPSQQEMRNGEKKKERKKERKSARGSETLYTEKKGGEKKEEEEEKEKQMGGLVTPRPIEHDEGGLARGRLLPVEHV